MTGGKIANAGGCFGWAGVMVGGEVLGMSGSRKRETSGVKEWCGHASQAWFTILDHAT